MVALNKQQFLEREVWDRRCRSRVLTTVEVPRSASSPSTSGYLPLSLAGDPCTTNGLLSSATHRRRRFRGWERWEKEAGARKVLSPIWPLASYGPIT